MDRNDVPIEILLKCPSLIDASTSEQVEAYLEPYKDAIASRAEDDSDVELNQVDAYDDDNIDEELEG
jgi:hypothetical protein